MTTVTSPAGHSEVIRPPSNSSAHPDPASLGSVEHRCRISFPTPCSLPAPCGMPCHLALGPERHAVVELGTLARMAVMLTPLSRGSFRQQAEELFAQLGCIVTHQPMPLEATTMMVFLRDEADLADCQRIIRGRFGAEAPVTTFVVQPPCCGAALGIELWAVGGPNVIVKRLGPQLVTVESEGIRWVHCGGISGDPTEGPYAESLSAFMRMEQQLGVAGVGFDQVVRTWIYLNQITVGEDGRQRYQEFNRARTDFFRDVRFGAKARSPAAPPTIYPASTGIGTMGSTINMSCVALDTQRRDVFLMPLENPQQTRACDYQAAYSPQSPKFSRAMAVVQGNFISTLVSGTASIVNAKTCHVGDVVRQTEQTIENIERLIAPDNFTRHGLDGNGAALSDIAKLRVYVKHEEDYERCRELCERLLPGAPAIYLHADVCRPDLLVEIEAVAFSPYKAGAAQERIADGRRTTRLPGKEPV